MGLQLLIFNMKWYRTVMRDMLMRYKIFIFVIVALLAPSFSGAVSLISMPFNNMLAYPNFNIKSFVISLAVLQLTGIAWANLHYTAILNRPWDGFLKTLPFSKIRSAWVDIIPIIVIDCVGWFVLMIAAIKIYLQNKYSIDLMILLIAKSFLLALLLVLSQLIVLKRRFLMAISLVVFDCLFTYSVTSLHQTAQLFSVLTLIICSSVFIYCCNLKRQANRYFLFEKLYFSGLLHPLLGFAMTIDATTPCLSGFSWLQIKLFIHGSRQCMTIWCFLLLITSFSVFIGYSGPLDSIHVCILIAGLFLNIFVASNFFSYLHLQRQTQKNFLSTLPISSWKIFANQYLLVASLVTFLNVLIICTIIFSNNIEFLYESSVALILTNILLAMTYSPQIYFKQYGLLVSFVMTLFFILLISTSWNIICHNHSL